MLNVNRKIYYITQKINIRLRMIEKFSIDRIWLIEYN